jgi:thioredoxin reductase (NADPH)
MNDPTAADPQAKPGAPPLLDDDDPALFPKLTDRQLDLIAPHGKLRSMEVGEVLFREGDVTYDVMVVLEGRVAVLLGSGDGALVIAHQRPRDLMVELSLFTGQPVGATAIVQEAGKLLVVAADEFRALVGRELVFGDFVLQTLFRRRRAIERLGLVGIRIVGSRFDRDTHRLREFAARNRVLHDWVDADESRAEGLLAGLGVDLSPGPIVLLGGGRSLRNPTNAELAGALGLNHGSLPAEKTYDLVVIGAGPAGLAASVYGASGGLLTLTLDAVSVGGQASTSARIENYLGFPAGISGAELAERGKVQAEKFHARILVPRRAVGLTEREGFHVVKLEDGEELLGRSVILALGVQYRRLPIRASVEFEGLGVAYAFDSAREQLRPGDAAVVVGGANSAGQAALALAEEGRRVYLVVRAATLQRSMARYLRDRLERSPAVQILLGYEVSAVEGDGHLERVVVESVSRNERRTLEAGGLVILIGATAPTEWLVSAIALDHDGFVLTGPALGLGSRERDPWDRLGRGPFLLETSRPGVFAAGDVRSGSTKMVAPAVGEGGMAVRFAAEHLARPQLMARS